MIIISIVLTHKFYIKDIGRERVIFELLISKFKSKFKKI